MTYLKSWFIIDLVSCLPYDVFNAFQHQESEVRDITGLCNRLSINSLEIPIGAVM